MAPATTVDEVIARLRELDATLPPSDGVRWFNRLYLEVTLAVAAYLPGHALRAPPFLEQLDVYFGNAFFAAYDAARAKREVPRAWAPLFEQRHARHVAPLQFATAGMNAHINHDLAVGVVDTCEALGMSPGDPQHADYQAINAILKSTEATVKRWLLTGAIAEIDREVAPADDVAAIWSITRARDAAWIRAQVIWHLRSAGPLRDAYLATNERATELAGRAILLPLPG
jgi:hypothetical protein